MANHPYCCNAFAEHTNEYSDDDAIFQQDDDGSWTIMSDSDRHGDLIIIDVKCCPYCGAPVDNPGIEKVRSGGHELYHADGTVARYRDLAKDGIYRFDENDKLYRVDGVSRTGQPIILPEETPIDSRPLIVDGVQALHENGVPIVMHDISLNGIYSFDPDTRIVRTTGATTAGPKFVIETYEPRRPWTPPKGPGATEYVSFNGEDGSDVFEKN